jgi:hypothetical protein
MEEIVKMIALLQNEKTIWAQQSKQIIMIKQILG